ncbi:PAS domain-containing protein, partial [Streptomyces sp. B1866]|uniref:PAS domain-containing protein n=1 Tax=Streptomyces sp. B1866 TaxID=3075431 RepID=UPI00288D9969
MTSGRENRGRPPDPVRAGRLDLLAAVDAGEGDTDVLHAALLQATAELGGYGGMVHVCVRGGEAHLRLVSSAGLPRAFTRFWHSVSAQSPVALVRAVREDGFVYRPDLGVPESWYGRVPVGSGETDVPAGTGMAAAPVRGPKESLGVLSVLVPASRPPDPRQRAFLVEVARWAGGLLRLTPLSPEGVSPNLLGRAGQRVEPRQPSDAEGSPNWAWDLRTGELFYYEPLLEELGIDPAVDDGTIESWVSLIHPDDLAWVTAEVDRALRSRGAYDLTYRVRRADGSYARVQTHCWSLADEHGEPARIEGRTWSTAGTHAALESVGRALLHMSDGFLSLSGDGRVGFANAAAERLLGPAREMVGRVLWEVPALRGLPGVKEQWRRAASGGEPVGFEVPVPGRDQWYHLR